jgi:dTMP kinase
MRGGYGDEKYEKREMQEKVRELFYTLCNSGEEEQEDMVTIDAGGSMELVEKIILDVVRSKIERLPPSLRKVGKWKNSH